jgi:hypothetical protein
LTVIAIARTMKEFDTAVVEIFSANARDVPFAMLYHVDHASCMLSIARNGSLLTIDA